MTTYEGVFGSSYPVTSVRVPNGDSSGWFTHVRGAKVPRRAIVAILLGRYRGKIEVVQSTNLNEWD